MLHLFFETFILNNLKKAKMLFFSNLIQLKKQIWKCQKISEIKVTVENYQLKIAFISTHDFFELFFNKKLS